MPELPEVETVRRILKQQLVGLTLTDFDVYYLPLIEDGLSIACLKGQTLKDIDRIGKYLIFKFEHHVLVSHLRMEGKYYVTNHPMLNKHIHACLVFNDTYVSYHDTRKFGRMKVMQLDYQAHPPFNQLAKEPWELNPLDLYKQLKKRTMPLKQALLDQHLICGLGNIYANEVCFDMGLDPRTKVNRLSKKDVEQLVLSAQKILALAIQEGGTTIRSYTSSLGVDGRFQQHLMVHGRQGLPCRVCGEPIKKIQLKGRGTYFCCCQKRK